MVRTITGSQVYQYFKELKRAPEPFDPAKVACALAVVLAIAFTFIWRIIL